ncbi:MAG: non-canonical purine NTP diphosphatase [Bacteroidetes bacterium]|nr:non-canonical purine NTP diphosphatase [Bacteroidota bacterium]
MSQLVFASNNANKLQEIALLLPPGFVLKGLADIGCFDDLPETQPDIEGNALQKARYISEKYRVNCFADDTGLEIDALSGRPGVYSARYAGEQKNADDNMNKVLSEMKGISNRKARFKTVIGLVWNGKDFLFEGIVEGTITENKNGSMGFGYDPVFMPDGYSKTFAQMDIDGKNKISHRARAVNKLVNYLNSLSIR